MNWHRNCHAAFLCRVNILDGFSLSSYTWISGSISTESYGFNQGHGSEIERKPLIVPELRRSERFDTLILATVSARQIGRFSPKFVDFYRVPKVGLWH